jgi:hypothetical protein
MSVEQAQQAIIGLIGDYVRCQSCAGVSADANAAIGALAGWIQADAALGSIAGVQLAAYEGANLGTTVVVSFADGSVVGTFVYDSAGNLVSYRLGS